MPRPRARVTWMRRDSASSDYSDLDIDYVPILELLQTVAASRRRTPRTSRARRVTKKTPKKTPTPAAIKPPRDVNDSVIILDDSDDECVSTVVSRSRTINDNVKNKVEDVFKSSGLLSDEEDEPVQPIKIAKTSSLDINEPSSSKSQESVVPTSCTSKVIMVEDDLNEMNTMEDIKNYCDETEDILKNANAVLQKFAGITSQEEEPAKPASPEKKEKDKEEKKLECPICYENLAEKQAMTTKCGHLFCKSCIEKVATTIKKCPTCRKAVNKKNIIPIYI